MILTLLSLGIGLFYEKNQIYILAFTNVSNFPSLRLDSLLLKIQGRTKSPYAGLFPGISLSNRSQNKILKFICRPKFSIQRSFVQVITLYAFGRSQETNVIVGTSNVFAVDSRPN